MFYFTYDLGEFYVIREFNDSYDVEIVDILPFYDVRKIYHWCKFADLVFPYELNDCVYRILSKLDVEYEGWDCIEYCISSFHIAVINGDIKLYCKEKRK